MENIRKPQILIQTDGITNTKIFIDGKELPGVAGVRFSQSYKENKGLPVLQIELKATNVTLDAKMLGEAIKYLKRGSKVARKGWNGKKQYIQLATGISYKAADGEVVNCEHNAIGNMAVAFVGTSGVQMGWLASQADMLAEDWIFVE